MRRVSLLFFFPGRNASAPFRYLTTAAGETEQENVRLPGFIDTRFPGTYTVDTKRQGKEGSGI